MQSMMRHLIAGCLLLLVGTSWVPAETLRFAPLPMQEPERVVSEVYPLLQYLEAETGLSVQLVYTDSYSELLERMAAGEVDLTYLGPLPYIELSERFADVQPLVVFREPDGQPHYTCALVSFAGAPVNSEDWQQQAFALTQPLSTCGFFATYDLLKSQGVDLDKANFCYLERHDEVALSVVRGEFALGGMKTQIAHAYRHLGLKIELETQPFPGFALVANQKSLPKEHQQQMQQALLALDPINNPEDAARVADWGESFRFGAAEIRDSDYQLLRDLREGVSLPEECSLP